MNWQNLILKIAWQFPPYFFVKPIIVWFKTWPKAVEGLENLELIPANEGLLITPWHPHHLDHFPLGEVLRELFYKTREKCLTWFVDYRVEISRQKKYKFFSLAFKYVYMEFDSKSGKVIQTLDKLVCTIRNQGNVIFFPVGKAKKEKNDRKFWGASYLASKTNCLILPVWIGYDLPFWQINGTLFQMIREGAREFLTLRRHMIIRFGKPYRLSDYCSQDLGALSRNELAQITKEVILPQIQALSSA